MLVTAIIFAVGLATMYAAHAAGDHIFQTDHMAANKGKPGRSGWAAIIMHVWSYHLVMFFMLLLTVYLLQLPVTLLGFCSAIVFSAITHAILDRRWSVRWILEHTGSPEFAELQTPICGMYLADQSLHYVCLWIAALLLACL